MTRAQGSSSPTTTTPPTARAVAPGRTSDATPAVTAPMTSERRMVRGRAERRTAGSRRKGSVSAGESKGAAGHLGASGPAGPRRRRGRRARSHRRDRAGRKASRRQRTSVAADSASAPHTNFWGVQRQRDGEVGPAERLQVGRRDLPSVGEAVSELRTAEVDGV